MRTKSNSEQPLVSVVIPTYNYGKYLPDAIESVLSQTFKNYELIIVDDGSTDNTKEVVRPYLKNTRIRYHYQENTGQSSAKNVGIKLARGDFIAFLDADDSWLPDKLELQMKLFQANPALGVVYSRRLFIAEDGNDIYHEQPKKLYAGNVLYPMFMYGNHFLCSSTSVVRKECFAKVGLFDQALEASEDFDLWLRIAIHYPFDFVDKPLIKFRAGHSSVSKREGVIARCGSLIAKRFLEKYREPLKIPSYVIRKQRGFWFGQWGWRHFEQHRRWKAFWHYFVSLLNDPTYLFSLKGLLRCFLPYSVIRFFRELRRRR